MVFYNQPLATRFGTELIREIETGGWNSFDLAVAWVRASGIAHLRPALEEFLKAGGQFSVIVGIDFDNTTQEGLKGLLDLEACGAATTFVHHNEANPIFHPKLYLFRNQNEGKLIVGSNNITESGLFQNVEAGLEIRSAATDPIMASALNALQSWRDVSTGLAKRLDDALISELVTQGYILPESVARTEAAKRKSSRRPATGAKKLFGSLAVTPPQRPSGTLVAPKGHPPVTIPNSPKMAAAGATTGVVTPAGATFSPQSPTIAPAAGQVLLMRVRKAHVTDRPTQTQVPKAVANSTFFGGTKSVTSAHTGAVHGFHEAEARGIVNTLKLEIPEMRSMADPVIRFERTPTGIQYQVYDSSSPQGAALMAALQTGRTTSPPSTNLTKPSSPSTSTWWRFI